MFGKIYETTWWGFPTKNGWGNIYYDLSSSIISFFTSRVEDEGGTIENEIALEDLDESASILMIPSAIADGKLYSVLPEDGSGDFTFSRGSSATRVNEQGLIEDVQILSSNLVSNGDFSQEGTEQVTNGDFSNGLTNWTSYGITSVYNGVATIGASANSGIFQPVLSQNKSYKVTINVTSYNGVGQAEVSDNNGLTLYTINAVGEHTFTFKHTITNLNLIIRGRSNALFSIDNVSVKEVGQDWTLGTGWSIGDGKVISDGTQTSQSNLYQSGVVPINKTYKVNFSTVVTSGSLVLAIGGSNPQSTVTTSGTYTYTSKTTIGDSNLYFSASSDFIGSISNISVIEITDDTDLPRINYDDFSYQDSLGSEEVVNGDFDVNGNWTNFGTPLVSEQSSTRYYTSPFSWYIKEDAFRKGIQSPNNFTLTNGKTYNVSLWVYALDGAEILSGLSNTDKSVFTSHAVTQNEWTNITYSAIANATSASYISILTSSSTLEFYVDNISVKEYLGQEVVPNSGTGSLLLEPQSTNLITQSELFSDASWNKTNSSVVSGFTSPSGGLSAFKLVGDAVSSEKLLQTIKTVTNSTIYTASVFVKYGGVEWIRLTDAQTSNRMHFNTLTGAFGTPTGTIIDYRSTAFEDGWHKVSITTTSVATAYAFRVTLAEADNDVAYTGDGTSGVYIYGAQLEQQSYATSYIPTSGASSTRLADIANIDLTSFTLTSITETIGGVEQTPITVIPSIYTAPYGSIDKIIMI